MYKNNLIMEKLELKYYSQNIGCELIYENTKYRLDGVQLLSNGKIQLFCSYILHNASGIKLSAEECILILRPLSDLTKEIEINGEKFVPMIEIKNLELYSHYELEDFIINNFKYGSIESLSYQLLCQLFSWHFDVFGLINKGLAIDINTL